MNEPILTPTGWKVIGEIKVGDYVVAADGNPTKVTGVFPQGIKKIYRVESNDGSFVHASEDHLWEVHTTNTKGRNKPPKVMTTKEILEWPTGYLHTRGTSRFYLPIVEPIAYKKKNLPIDPYALGVLIGDGSCKYRTIQFCKGDLELAELMQAALPDWNIKRSQSENRVPTWSILRKSQDQQAFSNLIIALGLNVGSLEKFIPEIYLRGSIEQRWELLKGLLDTDTYTKETVIEYSTSSPQLAKDLVDLVNGLGGVAYTAQRITASGNPGWRLNLSFGRGIAPFKRTQKLQAFTPKTKYEPTRPIRAIIPAGEAECVCISIAHPRHLYVTRNHILTHNTLQALSAYHILKTHKLVDGILVIGPESARHGWIGQSSDSITKFSLSGHLVDGKPLPRSGLIYCSVDKTWRPKYATELLRRVKTGRWVLCCDEGHQLSPGSKRYSAVDLWASFCPYRWLLTGTPIANYPDRFYSMWRLLTRNDCTYPQWVEWFCKPDGTWHKQRLLWLQDYMRRVSRVRTRQEVAPDLPKTTIRTISVPLEGEQRLAYGELLRGAAVGQGGGSRMEWLGALAKLSSICSHHELQEGDRRPSARVAKLEILEGLLEGSGDAQAIIWSWHPGTLDWLARTLPCTSVTYHGGTSSGDRERAIHLFNSGERRLFLGNPSAAGVGLNLPNVNIRIYWDASFSSTDMTQSAGRNERGLKHDPKIEYRLVAQGSVEELCYEALQKKENLRNLVLGGQQKTEVIGTGLIERWRARG